MIEGRNRWPVLDHRPIMVVLMDSRDPLPLELSGGRIEGGCVRCFIGSIVPYPPLIGEYFGVLRQARVNPVQLVADDPARIL